MAVPPAPRPLAADDVAAVADLERRVFKDPWSARSFAQMLALPTVRGFAVDDERGRLIGYGLCSMVEDEGEILNLAVEPDLRRRGTGARLVDEMLGWLRSGGTARVFLEVRASNAAAIAVYERAGFRPLGTRRGYYQEPREDALTMALDWGARGAEK
jgi:ribosomal-protein-alanine N-acetyltransferase